MSVSFSEPPDHVFHTAAGRQGEYQSSCGNDLAAGLDKIDGDRAGRCVCKLQRIHASSGLVDRCRCQAASRCQNHTSHFLTADQLLFRELPVRLSFREPPMTFVDCVIGQ